jgi:hypothetical protein
MSLGNEVGRSLFSKPTAAAELEEAPQRQSSSVLGLIEADAKRGQVNLTSFYLGM